MGLLVVAGLALTTTLYCRKQRAARHDNPPKAQVNNFILAPAAFHELQRQRQQQSDRPGGDGEYVDMRRYSGSTLYDSVEMSARRTMDTSLDGGVSTEVSYGNQQQAGSAQQGTRAHTVGNGGARLANTYSTGTTGNAATATAAATIADMEYNGAMEAAMYGVICDVPLSPSSGAGGAGGDAGQGGSVVVSADGRSISTGGKPAGGRAVSPDEDAGLYATIDYDNACAPSAFDVFYATLPDGMATPNRAAELATVATTDTPTAMLLASLSRGTDTGCYDNIDSVTGAAHSASDMVLGGSSSSGGGLANATAKDAEATDNLDVMPDVCARTQTTESFREPMNMEDAGGMRTHSYADSVEPYYGNITTTVSSASPLGFYNNIVSVAPDRSPSLSSGMQQTGVTASPKRRPVSYLMPTPLVETDYLVRPCACAAAH